MKFQFICSFAFSMPLVHSGVLDKSLSTPLSIPTNTLFQLSNPSIDIQSPVELSESQQSLTSTTSSHEKAIEPSILESQGAFIIPSSIFLVSFLIFGLYTSLKYRPIRSNSSHESCEDIIFMKHNLTNIEEMRIPRLQSFRDTVIDMDFKPSLMGLEEQKHVRMSVHTKYHSFHSLTIEVVQEEIEDESKCREATTRRHSTPSRLSIQTPNRRRQSSIQ